MILIISFTSSFEISRVNSFSILFLPNLFISFEVTLLENPGNLSLAKGITTFVSAFFPQTS